MIRPTRLNMILQGLSIVLLLWIVVFTPTWTAMWAVGYALLWLVTLLDAFSMLGSRRITATFHLPPRLSLGEEEYLQCVLSNQSSWRKAYGTLHLTAEGALHDITPVSWSAPPNARISLDIALRSWRRGNAQIASASNRILSLLHLFERRHRLPTHDAHTQVFANILNVQRAAARNTTLQSYLQGLRVQRRVGDGQAFEALRQFQPGHDTRSIDWSVSARMRSLHVREFKEERNHNVVLAFDTGRLMARDVDGIARLDRGLNASLHLAYVALRMGDRVGLFGFDETTRRWSAPRPDLDTLQHLLHEAQHLPYTLNIPDFRAASVSLNQKLRRRSIIFLFTEIDGLALEQGLLEALAPLHRKHQVNLVTIRSLNTSARYAELDEDEIDAAMEEDLLKQQRNTVLRALQRHGIHVIDTLAPDLHTALLMRYQDVKQRGLL